MGFMLAAVELLAEFRWWSFIGVLLDLLGFSLLAHDVVSALAGEYLANLRLAEMRRAERIRRGLGYPLGSGRSHQEVVSNADAQREAELKAATRTHTWRRRRVCAGIALVFIGFALQMVGAIPPLAG